MADELLITRSPLVIPSALAANEMFEKWVGNHDLRQVTDADGMVWDIVVNSEDQVDQESHLLHAISLSATSRFSKANWVTSADEETKRLKDLIGNAQFEISIPSKRYTSKRPEDTRAWLVKELDALREVIRESSYDDIRRNKVARYVDLTSWFGRETPERVREQAKKLAEARERMQSKLKSRRKTERKK